MELLLSLGKHVTCKFDKLKLSNNVIMWNRTVIDNILGPSFLCVFLFCYLWRLHQFHCYVYLQWVHDQLNEPITSRCFIADCSYCICIVYRWSLLQIKRVLSIQECTVNVRIVIRSRPSWYLEVRVVSPLAWSPWHCLCPVPLVLVAMALPVSRPPCPGPHGTACVPMQIHPVYTCPDMKYDFSLKCLRIYRFVNQWILLCYRRY